MDTRPRRQLKIADLFAGCGGFSLGAEQAGHNVVVAVDNDRVLTSSYPYNFPKARVLSEDVCNLDGETIRTAAGGRVDGVVGGPPCQGFSDIGRRDPRDPRRSLVREFFRLVAEMEPPFFVMENVRGLGRAGARSLLDGALELVDDRYSVLGPTVWNAADFGAATDRCRLFVIGIHRDCGDPMTEDDVGALRRSAATVREAISDLAGAVAIGEEEGFDTWRIAKAGRPYGYARALRSADGHFTGHRKTKHSESVRARFLSVPEGGVDAVGRHPRLAWDSQCPVLRAGTGADRGSHQALRPIHPERPRVITIREAARLQGFPDAHRFHSTTWHSFRMIGNSVSPIIARAILTVLGRTVATGVAETLE